MDDAETPDEVRSVGGLPSADDYGKKLAAGRTPAGVEFTE
ncbi:hypothetical protein SDC9_147780 [bioreactor metagenome]|uniref:Uncharacterized protein n=1 Tax=bioreactor metagenome TaxID=1076179 RepID=A0A645EIM4_9ZZZZ